MTARMKEPAEAVCRFLAPYREAPMKKVYTHDSDWSSLREKIEHSLDTDTHPGGCWLWTAGKDVHGYGAVRWAAKVHKVHRAYLKELGYVVPDSLVVDHLCRNPSCANPEHLEVVTQRENMHRSPICVVTINAAKTECIAGHEFTSENTYIVPATGARMCRTCAKERRKRYGMSK